MAKSVSFGTEQKVKLKDSEYKNSSLVSPAWNVTFWAKKKVKEKDSEYNNFTVVGQIDCKKTKEKSKLMTKCFVNSFRKNHPISATNVPKLPGRPLFKPRKKTKKRIAISKLAVQ